MVRERLLERVRMMEESPDKRLNESSFSVVESVLRYLQKILNTKKGSVDIAPDFGIPDLTNISSSFTTEAIPQLESSIKKVIEEYEPRLAGVTVHFAEAQNDLMQLRFTIAAKVATDGKGGSIVFETIVDSDGQVQVMSSG